MKYRTIVADPPWPISWHGGGLKRPDVHGGTTKRFIGYQTMPLHAIEALPVAGIADDNAALFLWVTAGMNREGAGARVARAWGFEPVGEFVWDKGMRIAGSFPRSCHEILLVCRRGGHRFTSDRWVRSVQQWPISTRRHSRKPDAVLDMIEKVSDGPYVELFARPPHRLGWDVWGNESANTATLPLEAVS